MKASNRDAEILKRIIKYCDEINLAVTRFGNDFNIFKEDVLYMNACALCLLQIGELVNHLSTDFKESSLEIPWRKIKGMRNVVAHKYGSLNAEITWEAIISDVPELKSKCMKILSQQ